MLLIDSINSVASQVLSSPKPAPTPSSPTPTTTSSNNSSSNNYNTQSTFSTATDLNSNAIVTYNGNIVGQASQIFYEYNEHMSSSNPNKIDSNVYMDNGHLIGNTYVINQEQQQQQQQQPFLVAQNMCEQEPLTSSHSNSESSSSSSCSSNYMAYTNTKRFITDDDYEIIEICQNLLEQTFEASCDGNNLFGANINSAVKSENLFGVGADEFTQVGIMKCVKFCMNLPGNSDLCTDDRAKLLKYGVYEIAVLFLNFILSQHQ